MRWRADLKESTGGEPDGGEGRTQRSAGLILIVRFPAWRATPAVCAPPACQRSAGTGRSIAGRPGRTGWPFLVSFTGPTAARTAKRMLRLATVGEIRLLPGEDAAQPPNAVACAMQAAQRPKPFPLLAQFLRRHPGDWKERGRSYCCPWPSRSPNLVSTPAPTGDSELEIVFSDLAPGFIGSIRWKRKKEMAARRWPAGRH